MRHAASAQALPVLVAVSTLLGLSTVVGAQAQPQWNRRAEAVSILPDAAVGAPATIVAVFSVSALGLSAAIDLTTEVDFFVGTVLVDTVTVALSASPGSAGDPCELCDDPDTCVCDEDSPQGPCSCDIIVTSAATSAGVSAKDIIEVLLRPAPGALPDADTGDDMLAMLFEGDPIYWDRRITAAEVTPAGSGEFSLFVSIGAAGNYEGLLNLPAEAEVRLNGVPSGTFPAIAPWLAWNPCNAACDNVCALDAAGGAGVCGEDPGGPLPCSCQLAPIGLTIPLPAAAGDEITVILYPAPGAFPELPGFEGDVEVVCAGDLDGDGAIGIVELLFLLAHWGACPAPPEPCPVDLNGDGSVGIGDLLLLLAGWGPCG